MEETVIKMVLSDGKTTGIIECYLDDWYGVCYKIPRNEIKKSSSLKSINNSGVYILFGEDAETTKKIAYIGEAEKIYKRIEQHNKDTEDYWNECLVFVSENNSINKAHIKYVEHVLYNISMKANRYLIKNKDIPNKASLDNSEEIIAKKFINKIKLITSVLGYRIFDELVKNKEIEKNIFYLKHDNQVIGTSVLTDEGMVILKGSKIKEGIFPSLSPSLVNYCKKERSSSDIVNGEFINNHLCSSPSMAAVVLLGRNSNGRNVWKNKDGKSINDLNR